MNGVAGAVCCACAIAAAPSSSMMNMRLFT
jgi:hypothetical protein